MIFNCKSTVCKATVEESKNKMGVGIEHNGYSAGCGFTNTCVGTERKMAVCSCNHSPIAGFFLREKESKQHAHSHFSCQKLCCSNSLITPFSHFLLINFSKLQLRCCVRGYSYSANGECVIQETEGFTFMLHHLTAALGSSEITCFNVETEHQQIHSNQEQWEAV